MAGRSQDPGMGGRRTLARDFGALFAGLGLLLWAAAVLLTNLPIGSWRVNITIALIAAAGAGLGLFLVWGDEGNRLLNAAKSTLILLAFVTAVVTLLSWAASSQGPGT
jgi:hypothetical protein